MAATTLLTGATGLIGAHLVDVHREGDLRPIHRSETDLLEPGAMAELIRRTRPSRVVHLAWCASGSPGYRDADENAAWLARSEELVTACRQTGSHLVLAGTVADDGTGTDAYSRAKASLRIIAREASAGQPITWVRPHYVFDPARERPRLVANALASARSGTSVELADPHARHDFVHASDVAAALLLVLQRKLLGEIDIGSGTLHEVRELVEAMHVPWLTIVSEPSTAGSSPRADIGRLVAQGWEPIHSLQFFDQQKRTNDG